MSFPISGDGPVEFGAQLPQAVDLVVIGGGVIGICTALFARRLGLSVLVLEKGRVAAEQSSRNWGWIRVQGRDLAEVPIALESQDLWTALDVDCGGRLGVRQVGVTYLARSPREMAGFADWLQQAAPLGVSSKLLDQDETRALLGNPNAPWIGALHTPTDMKAEPWVAVPELARLAVAEGALIREDCAVRGVHTAGGRVTGVVSEAGRVAADRVVLAGGAWSSLFLRRHGVEIPQLSVRCTAMATGPLPQVVATAAVDDRMAFRPRDDGGYTLAPAAYAELFLGPDCLRHARRYLPLALSGEFDTKPRGPAPKGFPDALGTARRWRDDEQSPFERMRILNPAPSAAKLAELRNGFAQIYPEVGEVSQQAGWAGMIDVLPDVVPVVDHVGALPGLIVVTGMCGHGFGAGPGFGRIAAHMAAGRDPGHDISRFRITRFSDGSPLRRGPNL
ncbi:NAD(P)/FAD-dependent oxidoreductase [Tropicibacter oceani]|uniref:FAD-dependent oxidoreductase n=1 Tax=Tropicibacter oceani TaxID=3058420 RepID=A0ABY8QF30_9RHOB|nr:FAD-dependent oxidoreductase [Tropicibacter oceani]WGW03239.1 FAD-dependent oxidoreductase [Tropicibacter oceani]